MPFDITIALLISPRTFQAYPYTISIYRLRSIDIVLLYFPYIL